ncbi:hypothetical protein N566_11535 [Streptomycetaceae bacterium MP113-05]|nr:hypothetical protein N566_11535 [Streptomycetaceae bacterium MP113-05]
MGREVVTAFLQRPAEMAASAEALRSAALQGLLPSTEANDAAGPEDAFTAPEGRLLSLLHLRRERDPRLRRRKIAAVRASGAPLSCAVCDFDFGSTYGELGEGYVEVHHVVPLRLTAETVTTLDDLALLCANCHRMCHRSLSVKQPWRSPDDLRQLLRKVR